MPIYEYACRGCGHEFETLVRNGAQPDCPGCHSTALDKKLSVFSAAAGGKEPAMPASGPCGTCGNPAGPGSCAIN